LSVFVDSSVWFAAAVARDHNNQRAKAILEATQDHVTTDHVLIETWLLLNSRYRREAAERFWNELRQGDVTISAVTVADLEIAWAIGEAFPDQDFSIVDRTSFAVMERLGITQAASFDNDFAIYRFGLRRDRAFEILGSAQPASPIRKRRHSTASETYNLFREAILHEKQLTCTYRKHHRELCPHIIGHRKGQEVVLAFQFAGQSERGLPRSGQWRCFYLSEVSDTRLRDGPWHEGPSHMTTQSCVETVDLDINIHVRKRR
jgi:predicted nucleic acid-binding protein